ncbi:hypothetical protein [Noviluteimonas gilva]|uniref:Uncharacterized protein n=1 Tax=Noviluteimonas gilva TaxID=2682097 RepID=A0A7C9LI44_9GAMM|nr:hypothetical protein [Lysobacter gilvus]MUV14580.1 hypothetical protein [Lysobacter gilvus]
MTIDDYLNELNYALSGVINALWHEQDAVDDLQKQLNALQRTVQDQYRRAEAIARDAETPDDVMLATAMQWETYFGDDKAAARTQAELVGILEKLKLREFSRSSLAGSLLQFAKQGLSAAYGEPKNWPTGRMVGSQGLSTVVLQARNQAEHWEEGKPRDPVVACFDALAKDCGAQFAAYRTRNLAFEVVTLLGWRSVDAFGTDMRSAQ